MKHPKLHTVCMFGKKYYVSFVRIDSAWHEPFIEIRLLFKKKNLPRDIYYCLPQCDLRNPNAWGFNSAFCMIRYYVRYLLMQIPHQIEEDSDNKKVGLWI